MDDLEERAIDRDERRVREEAGLARYEAERKAAVAAIASTGTTTMPLDQAARLLPEHPEWGRYAPKRMRRAKGGR